MGVMNLVAIPLGAMPMCHGSGGVAGKYAFGARTAGSNLILGAIYAIAAVVAVGIVAAFPLSMLGVVLALIAVELGRAGLDSAQLAVTVGVGVVGLVTNVGIAFVLGALGYLLLQRLQ
jgi:MFS superfamily sulfate permease-like transporter